MSSHYVYVIVNKINLKLYFGSHTWDGEGLDKNYYGSGKIIKQAVNKYGKDNFIVYPIKFYDNADECRKAEEELLTKYNIASNPYCYNIKNGAVGWTSEDMKGKNNPMYGRTGEKSHMYGRTRTEETRKKISQALKGRTGEKSHMYGKHLSESTRKKISQALKGRTGEKSHMYGKHLSEEHKQKISQAQKKTPIVAIQKDTGKIRIFESQMECIRVLGLNPGSINHCLKGGRNHTGGYLIKYLKRCSTDYKITKRKAKKTEKIKLTTKIKGITPIVAIQKDTGKIRMFKSQSECSRVLGIHQGNINKCLKGRQKTYKGYTFKYVEQLDSGIYEGML